MDGLTIKNGRLINNRPNNITGIQEAANIRRAAKRARKMEEIAEGIRLAEQMKEVSDMMNRRRF
jgi:pyruvate-formate lyase